MLIRYLPRKFDEKVPVPVQKKIDRYAWSDDGQSFVLEISGNRKHKVGCAECSPLMSSEKRIKTWFKLAGLFVLLIAFCAGSFNIIHHIAAEGLTGLGFLTLLQLMTSLVLVGYVSWLFKINVERSLYGGFVCRLGEIYFQSEDEKTTFNDISRKQKEIPKNDR